LDIPYTGKVVSDIFYDKSNNDYYVGMLINSIGIGKWNTVTKKWTFIKPIGNPDPSDFPAYLFLQDSNGTLWVATGKRSLWYVDKKENKVKPFLFPNGEPIDNEGYSIVGLFEDSRKQLWIGTSANGIICLNKERTKAVYYKHDDNDSSSLIKGTHFRAIEEDNHGRLWFGNNMGFCVFEPKTGKFSHQIADELSSTGVRIGTTTTILRDTIGRMWLTMEGQGLVRITELENGKMSFKTYRNEEGLKDLAVRYMTKDKNGCFWIVNNGLLYFNPYDETYMLTDASNGMLNNYSNDDRIMVDEYGNVFMGNQVT
jgi:ligand-binding sensor domain-containing protein